MVSIFSSYFLVAFVLLLQFSIVTSDAFVAPTSGNAGASVSKARSLEHASGNSGGSTLFGNISVLDWAVVILSLVATLILGLWTAAKTSGSSADYFVGSRAMGWQVVGASMFASNIGTEHFIGQAGSAAAGGMGVGLYEWLSIYLLLSLAYFFAPFYLRLGLTTVSQYAQERYGVILVEVLYGGEVNVYFVAVILVLITASYTIAGGLKAVMITDALQMAIFVVGGVAGLIVSITRVSYSEMQELLPSSFFHVIRPSGEYAWHAMFFGQPIGSCWYWCIDQFIVQRVLAAKNLEHAQSGCLFAAFMKFLPPYLLCIPGMAARALFEKCRRAPTDSNPWCSTGLDDAEKANKAYPLLVVHEFPAGLRGLIITAMFMAMLSSLSSVYNSAATLITIDVYKSHWNPAATERQLLLCGRLASLFMTALTFAWFPVISGQHGLLYLFVQSISMHIFPTLVIIFILGMLTTRVNVEGAIAGLILGVILGVVQMVAALAAGAESCKKPYFKWECLHFNHFALVLAAFVALVSLLTSRLFGRPSAEQLSGRTIWTLKTMKSKSARSGRKYASFEDVDDSPSSFAGGDLTTPPVVFGRDVPESSDGTTDKERVADGTAEIEIQDQSHVPSAGNDALRVAGCHREPAPGVELSTDVSPVAATSNPCLETEEAGSSAWTRHDRINLVAAFLLFSLMAVNLIIWA